MQERRLSVEHITIYHSAQHYAPALEMWQGALQSYY